MNTNEIKNIWKTLADEELIKQELAEENIERILTQKSSRTVAKLNKKLKTDFITNAVAAIIIFGITIFATLFLRNKDHNIPLAGYIFLLLCFGYYVFKAIMFRTRISLIKQSYNSSPLLESLKMIKAKYFQATKKENRLTSTSMVIFTIYANVLINLNTDISNFKINSLQGYVLLISIIFLASLPFVVKFYKKIRFGEIMNTLNSSIKELEE